jgi:hypothetical protein
MFPRFHASADETELLRYHPRVQLERPGGGSGAAKSMRANAQHARRRLLCFLPALAGGQGCEKRGDARILCAPQQKSPAANPRYDKHRAQLRRVYATRARRQTGGMYASPAHAENFIKMYTSELNLRLKMCLRR